MRKYLAFLILTMMPFVYGAAQDHAVELEPEKKVIYIDKLGLPDNTPLLEVLRMIPELVVREGDEFLVGYDVFLDSKSVAYNKTGILGTMKLFEVEKIEISTSSIASQQRNGMAGAIKIVSKSMSEGFSGSVTAISNTLWETYPNMNLNYRTEKLELRGNLGLQYYSHDAVNYFERNTPPRTEVGKDTINENLFQETARLYLKYNISKKDKLKVWVIESFGVDSRESFEGSIRTVEMPQMGKYIYQIREVSDTSQSKISRMNFSAFSEYEHTFNNDMSFSLSADYIRDGNRDGTTTLVGIEPERPQVVRSEAKFSVPFHPEESIRMELSVGGDTEYDIKDKKDIRNRSFYASPFLEFGFSSPKWKLNSGIRYQHFAFDYDKSSQGMFSNSSNDLTFNVNALYQIKEHQALKFFVTKNIIRPSQDQMYPVVEWNQQLGAYIAGNEHMKSSSMYSFDAEYITDWKIGAHSFIANLGLSYDRVDGLGELVRRYDELFHTFYMTYANSGIDNIFRSKANFVYNYGIFSVSLAGNWYHNIKKSENGVDNVDSFNIALSPIFSFRNDWTLSGTFRYNNALVSNDSRLGECLYSNLRLAKSFGRWIVSAVFSDIFGYASENYEYKDGGYYYTMFDQYPRCLELGVTYKMGR